ncbi:hypothetical protein [Bacillus sp. V3-13]|uniref:hypothetical protein n=1 Tax=Bacillus sp. V3-13 TaxID=2053728 RepID=UPI0015E15064|nr:hypothetical protein [Bacillus sp. V3-13]
MAKIKLNQLKKELKVLDQKELIDLIVDIFKVSNDVQHYLSNKFIGEEAITDLYEKTKKKVEDEFFPDRGFRKLRLKFLFIKITDYQAVKKPLAAILISFRFLLRLHRLGKLMW